MIEPNEQDREAARLFVENHSARLGTDGMCADKETFISFLATALANERARGRDEAKAEDATLCRHLAESAKTHYGFGASEVCPWCDGLYEAADKILAPASGPTVEQQVRAEIAEAVKAMPQRHFAYSEHGTYVRFSDVLAIIERGEK